ncbi:MipA/OmpV family protein [Thalassotalea euphylliae]|uniref:MipA/OmpV family protein n=1 Tax=Thalassotalea euphylliae TaxID=1655234 RepID=A0A3E0TMI9_9GAMM|nr:MipA/OmpV family protein [Thalassotalea euphylliae]REL25779.1 MipA/OmpV family protein [Thalassotalea euphylliae]
MIKQLLLFVWLLLLGCRYAAAQNQVAEAQSVDTSIELQQKSNDRQQEDSKQLSAATEESKAYWELDLGLVATYRNTLIDSIDEFDGTVELDAVISGGFYVNNFFAEVAPLSGRPFTLGHILHKSETRQLSLIAESLFFELSEDDQERGNLLDGIEKREISTEIGFEYFGIFRKFDVRLAVVHDALSRHHGTVASLDVSRPYFTRHLMFLPGISVSVYDDNATDYYYGVSAEEVTDFRPLYRPGASWVGRARLYVERPMTDDWSIIAAASVSLFSDNIRNSPLVSGRDAVYSLSIGALWTF